MTISERIFALMQEKNMSQKEFAEKTGIAQSSISDWKRKKTNPTSDKILLICNVLDVTPYELLSGYNNIENANGKNKADIVVKRDSELGELIMEVQKLKENDRARVCGYVNALREGIK